MSGLRSPGQMLSVHARLRPDDVGIRDLDRSLTFRQWNARACRLANALLALGLNKGDRVAVLAYNCIEWGEIYAATAKSGLVAVPVNFRLVGREIRYIAEDAGIAALIVQHDLVELIDEIRDQLTLPRDRFILFGAATPRTGFRLYEALLAGASDDEPTENVAPGDPWTLMYTSGTTGNPKGVVRNHLGAAHLSLVTSVELGIRSNDTALLAMPMCHANSLYFFGAFTTCGAACTIYSRKAFDPENFLRALAGGGATFTSLVPTHYIMLLGLSAAVRASCDLTRVTRLMISSAPARPAPTHAVMENFTHSRLLALYGATETGWVTMLHPDEQFSHLGSVGRECVGSAPIRILDEQGQEVPDGEAGELYSCTPYTFDGYWGLPEKTRAAFHGAYCTVGDMARRDEAGFIRLVDRKSNMIISGGENIYPSEVETLVGGHPMVKDVAVIGVPDEKWGERVHAVVVPHDGVPIDEATLQDWVRTRIAGYKCPKSYAFIAETEMPRNATGKVLHRELRARFGGQAGGKP